MAATALDIANLSNMLGVGNGLGGAATAPAPSTYSQVANGTGGFNYFQGKTPVTVQQYNMGTGQNVSPSATSPKTTAVQNGPANPNNTASPYTDESGDIAIQNADLGAAGTSQTTGLNSVAQALQFATGEYNDDLNSANANYTTGSNQNENNLQETKQEALLNAAQGRQGLFGTLASLGALNGSGINLANSAVQSGANSDLTTAGDTYATNQGALDSSIGNYRKQVSDAIAGLNQGASNDDAAVKNSTLKDESTAYTDLANDYKAENDTADYNKYAGLAAGLAGNIATTNIPQSNLSYTGSSYTAPSLASYLGVGNNTTVGTTPGNATNNDIPGLVAIPTKKVTA